MIRSLRFSTGGGTACVLAVGPPDRNVADGLRLWNVDTGLDDHTIAVPDWVLDAVMVDPERVVVSSGGHLWVLEARSGAPRERIPFGRRGARELATDRGGRIVAAAFAGLSPPLHVADLETRSCQSFKPPSGDRFTAMFPAVTVSGDGSHVALSFGFASTYAWDLRDGSARRRADPFESDYLSHPSVADDRQLLARLPTVGSVTRRLWLSSDGRRMAVAGMIPYRHYAPHMCLWLFDWVEDRSTFVSLDTTFAGVDLTADWRLCAASDGQTRDGVALWDLATGQQVARIEHRLQNISDIRLSTDGSLLAVVSESTLVVHRFGARRWERPGAPADGFWRLRIDGETRIVPVGSASFVGDFRRYGGEAAESWEGACRAAERVASGQKSE